MFDGRIVSLWLPKDRRPIYEWAHDNVIFHPPLTRTGPPDLSTSRHLLAPLDALQDFRVREVNVKAPPRDGKSLIMDLWVCWLVLNDPASTRAVFQDDQAAADHAERRGLKLLRSTKGVSELLPANRHQDRSTEIIFPNMELVYDGPSRGKLQSRGYRNVACDEIWLYKPGILPEAKGRLGDYVKMGTSKFLALSQGGEENSDWFFQFQSGVIHEWQIECQKCGHFMLPLFRVVRPDNSRWGFVFDDIRDQQNLFDLPKCIPTVRFECEKCGHPHTDSPRLKSEWNRTGKYVPENTDKNPSRVSFHWSALISWPWEELATHYIAALNALKQGMLEPLKAFIQKYPADFWSDQIAFSIDSRPAQTFDIQSEWTEEKFRFMTIDQQSEGVQWAVIRAWSKTGESRRLWFGKLYSTDEARAKQLEYKVDNQRVLKDSGYMTREVYAECCRYGWIALKGEDRKAFVWIDRKGNRTFKILRSYDDFQRGDPEQGAVGEGTRFARLLRWSVPSIADRLEGLKQGKGPAWGRPKPVTGEDIAAEREYDRQLSAEYKKPKVNKFTGKTELVWVCPSGNNHLNDCERMQVVAASVSRLLPDLITSSEEVKEPT